MHYFNFFFIRFPICRRFAGNLRALLFRFTIISKHVFFCLVHHFFYIVANMKLKLVIDFNNVCVKAPAGINTMHKAINFKWLEEIDGGKMGFSLLLLYVYYLIDISIKTTTKTIAHIKIITCFLLPDFWIRLFTPHSKRCAVFRLKFVVWRIWKEITFTSTKSNHILPFELIQLFAHIIFFPRYSADVYWRPAIRQ